MIKIFFYTALTLIVLGVAIFLKLYFFKSSLPLLKSSEFSTTQFTIQHKTYTLLVADTEAKREKGLMFYRTLDNVDGMIFLFSDKDYRSFWNKNTFMDLNLLWIDDYKVVGKSQLSSVEKTKSIVTVDSKEKVNKVIELPHTQ